ncbi:MAG: low molecular weight protein-tyrosine-phosphatase [Burkholderiales bacterium]
MDKIKILFVCLGNICRSPLAKGIFINEVNQYNLEHLFEVDAAGTSAYHVGCLPDSRAVKVAAKYGIGLTQLARQLADKDFEYYDYILVMDHRNYEDVTSLIKNKTKLKRIFLLRSFDCLANNNFNVPDPFYGLDADFEEVFAICQRSLQGFIGFLANQGLIKLPVNLA